MKLTIHPSIVPLNKRLLDLPVLNEQGVALRAIVAEDGRAVEGELEGLGEGGGRIGEEADLKGGLVKLGIWKHGWWEGGDEDTYAGF